VRRVFQRLIHLLEKNASLNGVYGVQKGQYETKNIITQVTDHVFIANAMDQK
jgi:hypothetical protein